jgi:hypothetical protein
VIFNYLYICQQNIKGKYLVKIMKKTQNISILAVLLIGLISGCSSEIESLVFEESNTSIKQSFPSVLPVNLGVAGDFAILSKSGITNVPPSLITGDVGTSPISGAALLLACTEVIGNTYTVDATGPLPCRITDAPRLTTAVLNMQAAYTDAAGRPDPNYLNLGAGNIGGLTLTPGLYKWTGTLLIPTDIEIAGDKDDVWIFQVADTFEMSSAVRIHLSGGAKARNIFWQVAGAVTLGTTSHFEGNLLGATSIAVQTGATINGRLLAQTAVTLQMNTITLPEEAPLVAVGDLIYGGVVFWVNPQDSASGLVCALENASNNDKEWAQRILRTGATGSELGSGSGNTDRIIYEHPSIPKTSYAAGVASTYSGGGFSDWFLPSTDELHMMYNNKLNIEAQPGMVGFNTNYWSSTEGNEDEAFFYDFSHGISDEIQKSDKYYVRAVRAF